MRRTSSVVSEIPVSGIRTIFDRVESMERAGRRLVRFDVGRPAIETPSFIVDAAKAALDRGMTKYVSNRGLPLLRDAIAVKLKRENGLDYNPDTEIIVTTGASEAVASTIFAIMEEGADMLVLTPAWSHYEQCVSLVRGNTIQIPLFQGQTLTEELLLRAVTPTTRLIILNSPGNPTGRVLSKEEMLAVLSVAEARDLYVISDEIYEYFLYKGEFISFASLPGARERTITINGFSKAFGMTGWRVGYLACPESIASEINKPHQYITVCATSFAQAAAVSAYQAASASFLDNVKREYLQKNEVVRNMLVTNAKLEYYAPDGAFYCFVKLPDQAPDANIFALEILEQDGVSVIPGDVFGRDFGRYLRISYGSCSLDDISKGFDLLLARFEKYDV